MARSRSPLAAYAIPRLTKSVARFSPVYFPELIASVHPAICWSHGMSGLPVHFKSCSVCARARVVTDADVSIAAKSIAAHHRRDMIEFIREACRKSRGENENLSSDGRDRLEQDEADGNPPRDCQPRAENPPSTGSAAPVTKSDAGLDKNTAAPARSSGSPHRPAGVRASTLS